MALRIHRPDPDEEPTASLSRERMQQQKTADLFRQQYEAVTLTSKTNRLPGIIQALTAIRNRLENTVIQSMDHRTFSDFLVDIQEDIRLVLVHIHQESLPPVSSIYEGASDLIALLWNLLDTRDISDDMDGQLERIALKRLQDFLDSAQLHLLEKHPREQLIQIARTRYNCVTHTQSPAGSVFPTDPEDWL